MNNIAWVIPLTLTAGILLGALVTAFLSIGNNAQDVLDDPTDSERIDHLDAAQCDVLRIDGQWVIVDKVLVATASASSLRAAIDASQNAYAQVATA